MLVLVAALLAQTLPHDLKAEQKAEQKAVATLGSPKATWEQRADAARTLVSRGHVFTEPEVSSLKKALAWPASRTSCSAPPLCVREISECSRPATFVFEAIATQRAAAVRFAEEAWRALSGSDAALFPYARQVLAVAGDLRVEPVSRQLIGTREWSCVGEAARLLQGLPHLSLETVELVRREFARRDSNRFAYAELIASRSEDWAQELASPFLFSPERHFRELGVAAALRRTASEQESQALRRIAACDPSAWLRAATQKALGDAGTALPDCPPARWTWDGHVASSGTTRISVSRASNLSPQETCDGGLGRIGAECLEAVNRGEWGGSLVLSGHTVVDDPFLQAVALLHRRDEWLVISALSHLQGTGGIGRLVSSDGGTRYEWLVEVQSLPVAWAIDHDELLLAVQPDDGLDSPCVPGSASGTVLFAFAADGGLSLGRSPATECLWKK